ncbi:MAG: YceD family protein [Acidimicrobiales bacterium]
MERRPGSGPQLSLPLNVSQVLRRPGVRHPLQRQVRLEELRVGDAVVPTATEIDVDLVLEASGSSVVASGDVRAIAHYSCRRCLDPFEQPLVARVREIFEVRPTEGETYPLHNEHLDLVPLVRDALLLALPLAPLCAEDCSGPAPERFPTGEPDEPVLDPRWAALDQLKASQTGDE